MIDLHAPEAPEVKARRRAEWEAARARFDAGHRPHLPAWAVRLYRLTEDPAYSCPCGACDGEGDTSKHYDPRNET